MCIRILSLVVAVFLLMQPAWAADGQDSFKIVMPYNLVCERMAGDNIGFKFQVQNAEFTISSKVEMVKSENQLANKIGMVGASGGLLLPIVLIFPDYMSQTVGGNNVAVTSVEVVSKQDHANEPVQVIINGIDYGIHTTNAQGEVRLNTDEVGVYELTTTSSADGLTLSKEFFIE